MNETRASSWPIPDGQRCNGCGRLIQPRNITKGDEGSKQYQCDCGRISVIHRPHWEERPEARRTRKGGSRQKDRIDP